MIKCIKLNKKPVKDISQMQQVLVIKYWGLWVGLEVVWKIGPIGGDKLTNKNPNGLNGDPCMEVAPRPKNL